MASIIGHNAYCDVIDGKPCDCGKDGDVGPFYMDEGYLTRLIEEAPTAEVAERHVRALRRLHGKPSDDFESGYVD